MPCLEIWWPENPRQVLRLLDSAPTISVMQCSDPVAEAVDGVSFRRTDFYTLLIDLRLSANALRQQLHRKSCRAKISRAENLGCRVSVNEKTDEALKLLNQAIRRKGYRPVVLLNEWEANLEHSDVFAVEHEGRLAAAHVVLTEFPTRARLLFSATAQTANAKEDRLIGCLNRYLHWSEFLQYQDRGFRIYDFGGIALDPQRSALHSLAQFKLSFGGKVVRENHVRLAADPRLRGALHGAACLKTALSHLNTSVQRLRSPWRARREPLEIHCSE